MHNWFREQNVTYKWRVDIMLNGRNDILKCVWSGSETNSTDVATRILTQRQPQDFVGMYGLSENHNVFVRVGEIVALDIYPISE